MSKRTVLVCDDEPHILHVVASKLRNAGFEVLTAEDGGEALELARAHHPHLVLTDCQMPELSGLELATLLHGQSDLAQVPVLMLTARGYSIAPADLEGTNIREVIPKPFSPREILQKVQHHLGMEALQSV
ncbi:MAG: response regulator [Phycisphaerae bacterium]|nr:response regulator [Phycisphaerae bacterium]NUQ45570.1 response regulator [Phycisphaerae bacterium]